MHIKIVRHIKLARSSLFYESLAVSGFAVIVYRYF